MPTPIDRDALQRLLVEQQAQLVEVLPAAEYEDEHLPGAINIPLKAPWYRLGRAPLCARLANFAENRPKLRSAPQLPAELLLADSAKFRAIVHSPCGLPVLTTGITDGSPTRDVGAGVP
jgi:hypothetical protein